MFGLLLRFCCVFMVLCVPGILHWLTGCFSLVLVFLMFVFWVLILVDCWGVGGCGGLLVLHGRFTCNDC